MPGILNIERRPLLPSGSNWLARVRDKVESVAKSRYFCAAMLWMAAVLPFFHTALSGWVAPAGLALAAVSKAIPALQFLATATGAVLATLGLVTPGAVLKSIVGLADLGRAAVPAALLLASYGLSVLLFTFKPLLACDFLSFKLIAACAAASAFGFFLLLLAVGPKRPGCGLLVALLASGWALLRSLRADFDKPPGGYAPASR